MTNQNDAVQALYCSVEGQNIVGSGLGSTASNLSYTTTASSGASNLYYDNSSAGGTLWGYWQNQYYPYVIKESYPVYIQEKAMDKGKQAFELLKALMDKNLVKVDKVKDFVEAMDTILKTL